MPLLRRANGADRTVSAVVAGKPLGLARQLMIAARLLPPPISALLAAASFASATGNASLLSRLPPGARNSLPAPQEFNTRSALFAAGSVLPSRHGVSSGSPSATLAPTES
jgi:hypothetical protein